MFLKRWLRSWLGMDELEREVKKANVISLIDAKAIERIEKRQKKIQKAIGRLAIRAIATRGIARQARDTANRAKLLREEHNHKRPEGYMKDCPIGRF